MHVKIIQQFQCWELQIITYFYSSSFSMNTLLKLCTFTWKRFSPSHACITVILLVRSSLHEMPERINKPIHWGRMAGLNLDDICKQWGAKGTEQDCIYSLDKSFPSSPRCTALKQWDFESLRDSNLPTYRSPYNQTTSALCEGEHTAAPPYSIYSVSIQLAKDIDLFGNILQ